MPAQAGKFTVARYFYETEEDEEAVVLPFAIRESHMIEGSVCKLLMRFEINRS